MLLGWKPNWKQKLRMDLMGWAERPIWTVFTAIFVVIFGIGVIPVLLVRAILTHVFRLSGKTMAKLDRWAGSYLLYTPLIFILAIVGGFFASIVELAVLATTAVRYVYRRLSGKSAG